MEAFKILLMIFEKTNVDAALVASLFHFNEATVEDVRNECQKTWYKCKENKIMRPDFNKMELIPAIVQDYQTKEVLMLAYVNEEAYDQMLEMNQTVFYSRSSKKIMA